MRGIARNWIADGICVLMIHPGWMRTTMGGGDAPLLPGESAIKVKQVIDRAGPAHNGRYVDTMGNDMPW